MDYITCFAISGALLLLATCCSVVHYIVSQDNLLLKASLKTARGITVAVFVAYVIFKLLPSLLL